MVSIVVCTRDRAELLDRCLKPLARHKGEFEVLVVDQGDTPAAIPDDSRFRRLADPGRGLAKARNIGVSAAVGSVVAFVDDDAVPDANYIGFIAKAFEENPNLAALAGRILTLEDGRPYARTLDNRPRVLGRGDWRRFFGGNFAIRRTVLDRIGLFDERFGAGRRWASGEETDYFFRMQYRNCPIAYLPEAVVRHPRQAVETPPRQLRATLFASARGQGAMFARHCMDFANYGMVGTLAWEVGKPSLRLLENVLALRWHRVLLFANVAWGKCVGFAEFLLQVFRKRS
jgi:glycosyltransferase involved in cell wall biosynthesis